MNHLSDFDELLNRYFIMRHGHSQANQQGVIVSHPDNGITQYGLSDNGRAQVAASLQQASAFDSETLIVSSDFRRARETAEMAHAALACNRPVRFEPRLRERDFGEFELGTDDAYAEVWREDIRRPEVRYRGVEIASQVMARVTALIVDYEQKFSGRDILVISHGDALQILQTAFARKPAAAHRSQQHLQTAEIRQLLLP